MSINEEILKSSPMGRRLRAELKEMKKQEIYNDDNDITIIKSDFHEIHFIIKNKKDNRLYKFIIPSNYPFNAPRLFLNNKPYRESIKNYIKK
jgi:ubiquitin-protein ligase